ncbi:MAG: hypothetical protein ABIF09_01260 [Gemmatimonadota bacterium]
MAEPLVSFLSEAMEQIEKLESAASTLNFELKLAWRVRAKLSDVEGRAGRVVESLIELCDAVGTDESEALMEEWGK